jgi:hypothetical protein
MQACIWAVTTQRAVGSSLGYLKIWQRWTCAKWLVLPTVVTTVLVLDRPQQHEFQRLSCLEKFAGVFVAADPNSFTKISVELRQPFGTTPV